MLSTEVVIAVVNLDRSQRLHLSYWATSDDTYPYVLGRFDAVADEAGVRLLWSTQSESDVFGWWIRRGEIGAGFAALNPVLMPGGSVLGSGQGWEYAFRDSSARPGETYYYYVEALTGDGLPASSHLVTVRVPAPP